MSRREWPLEDGLHLVARDIDSVSPLTNLSLYHEGALVISVEVEPYGEVMVEGRGCAGITKATALADALRAVADTITLELSALQDAS